MKPVRFSPLPKIANSDVAGGEIRLDATRRAGLGAEDSARLRSWRTSSARAPRRLAHGFDALRGYGLRADAPIIQATDGGQMLDPCGSAPGRGLQRPSRSIAKRRKLRSKEKRDRYSMVDGGYFECCSRP